MSSTSETEVTDEESYEVERILEHKIMRNGTKKYLVRWKDYPDMDTWEVEEHLNGCKDLLKAYWKRTEAESKRPPSPKQPEQRQKQKSTEAKALPPSSPKRRSLRSEVVSTEPSGAEQQQSAKRQKVYVTEIKKERKYNSEAKTGDSWEDSVKSIDEVDKDETGKLWFLVSWKENTLPSWVPASTAYVKFPQYMLKWYEERIRFKHVD